MLGNEKIITVPAGVYDSSQVITLKPIQGRFQHFLTLKSKNDTIRFLETEEGDEAGTLRVRPGDAELQIHISSTISTTSFLILDLELVTQDKDDQKLYAPIP